MSPNPAHLLLKAYYERLYELMEARRADLLSRMEELLAAEIPRRGFRGMDGERLTAYREACVAFIDERLEAYNPLGIQYTFGSVPSRLAAELEFELNWYNSRAEFADLVAQAPFPTAASSKPTQPSPPSRSYRTTSWPAPSRKSSVATAPWADRDPCLWARRLLA
jgi:hypothetical protein